MSMFFARWCFSVAAVLLVGTPFCGEASTFLSRDQGEELTPELELTILEEIEHMLGGQHKDLEGRLSRIEDSLRATYQAMPKNKEGRLHHTAVRYTLHSYFVRRHAWFVRGISELAETSSSSSPSGLLQDRVDDFIQGAFERRLGSHGLDLREVAALAATYENLVHHESMSRLTDTYRLLKMKDRDMEVGEVDEVLETYMMGYIMALNYSALVPKQLSKVRSRVYKIYPTWDETRSFLREVRERDSFQRSFFGRADVEETLTVVGDQYGRWQNKECQRLKEQLLALEDTSIGTNGSGRVRISDFYGSALRDGNWQFSESMEYLASLGALDTHDPNVPRVIIPNYVNSPSNCIASSKFYSVCCINECEGLMDRIEHHFGVPSAPPGDVAAFVAGLSSSSVLSGRQISPILLDRLDEIAEHHGGLVPLHGRLFAQWMHHAYPRECPHPHLPGAAKPKTTREYYQDTELKPTVSKDQMESILQSVPAADSEEDTSGSDEVTLWNHQEELYVGAHPVTAAPTSVSGPMQRLRPLVYLCAAVAAAVGVARRSACSGASMAKAVNGAGTGKDLFV